MVRAVDDLIEVFLPNPDDFLKIKETLTRIGIASKKNNTLYQSCHILHKQGRYYITHFKEMFSLDGKFSNFSLEDEYRRNTIVDLLNQWGLITLSEYTKETIQANKTTLAQIKIIPYKEKSDWVLVPKYSIGNKK